MKLLLPIMLFTSIAFAQKTSATLYYGAARAIGTELIFKETFGVGFAIREKQYTAYFTKSIGNIGDVKFYADCGVSKYNNFSPMFGLSSNYRVSNKLGLKIGMDTFSGFNTGILIFF